MTLAQKLFKEFSAQIEFILQYRFVVYHFLHLNRRVDLDHLCTEVFRVFDIFGKLCGIN